MEAPSNKSGDPTFIATFEKVVVVTVSETTVRNVPDPVTDPPFMLPPAERVARLSIKKGTFVTTTPELMVNLAELRIVTAPGPVQLPSITPTAVPPTVAWITPLLPVT
jgi:hypothetical protein